MAYNSLEEQELNEIKSWWKENYKSLIVTVVLGASGVFGWQFWQSHQANNAQKMSVQYEQILATGDATLVDNFVKEHGKSGYSVLALLEKARLAVQKQDFAQAELALKDAMAQSPDDILASISAVRLAELQINQKQFDVAQNTLSLVKDNSWDARKALLTGEIQLAKGDNDGAKQSFETALKAGSALEQQEAQVRLNNLAK